MVEVDFMGFGRGQTFFQIRQKGIGNAFAMVGGTNAWKTANYPMEKSEEVKK